MSNGRSSQSMIQHLEDNSLLILSEALADVRANGGASIEQISDDDLRVALYTVLLKIVDILRETAAVTTEAVTNDVKAVFMQHAKTMMEAIDGQSVYTTGHTEAVVGHCVQMASRLGLSDEEIEDIEYAAWIHNLGMMNQSHRMATIPRTLTHDELKLARNHTVVGAEMIRPIEFLSHLVPVVRYHHSRFDGGNASAEPATEDLPLAARIICITDAYQAMLEPRAYRAAMKREEALMEIEKGSGGQFDPKLVPLTRELN